MAHTLIIPRPVLCPALCVSVLQENRFLLGLAGTVVIVLLVAALLLVLMSRAFKKEQEMLQQQSGHDLPAGITRDRTPENKIKSCYINKGGNDLQMLLSQTRPGAKVLLVGGCSDVTCSAACRWSRGHIPDCL